MAFAFLRETASRLSRGIASIGQIVLNRRADTADTDLRLCRFFGLSDGYWLRAQAAYDTEMARRKLGPELRKIQPWTVVACL